MSISPPLRKFPSTSSSKREEDLINAYEAEEERIINLLSRKLEQLREEKIILERAHEEESELHVNRLSRELSALRMVQQQNQTNGITTNGESGGSLSRGSIISEAENPSTNVLLDALRRENESLRNRLVTAERDYIRVTRLNDVYREELIDHRRRLGISVDNLIGITPSTRDAYSQPIHRRTPSTNLSSPTASMVAVSNPVPRPGPSQRVPIPRPSSRIHRPNALSPLDASHSHSPSSAESPCLFSPVYDGNPESYVSGCTQLTTPPSSSSLQSNPPAPYPMQAQTLSYPSVPPPSLSSSLGSPVVSFYPSRDYPPSPVEPFPLSRQPSRGVPWVNSNPERRVAETGNLRDVGRSQRESVERGGRLAETGTLNRSRAGSSASTPAVVTGTLNERGGVNINSTIDENNG